ncbi:MAG: hypothetical protein WC756_21170 [Taibaiella sp.]
MRISIMAKDNKILKLPSYDYLHACFSYDPNEGLLRWKKRPQEHFKSENGFLQFNAKWPGLVAGVQKKTDIRVIRLNGHNVQARRIIWKMVYGDDPVGVVYNINGITGDDRIDNLAVKGSVFGDKREVVKVLPVGLEYDRETITWGSRYIGWYRTKAMALEVLGCV